MKKLTFLVSPSIGYGLSRMDWILKTDGLNQGYGKDFGSYSRFSKAYYPLRKNALQLIVSVPFGINDEIYVLNAANDH
ncbi:MAG TPA: hypothetical protein VNS32_21525 [Flavisolibacter sp.]|nr:hypothetical protein [Flavisolibacter sp.]